MDHYGVDERYVFVAGTRGDLVSLADELPPLGAGSSSSSGGIGLGGSGSVGSGGAAALSAARGPGPLGASTPGTAQPAFSPGRRRGCRGAPRWAHPRTTWVPRR